jgi:hypothetical protein
MSAVCTVVYSDTLLPTYQTPESGHAVAVVAVPFIRASRAMVVIRASRLRGFVHQYLIILTDGTK